MPAAATSLSSVLTLREDCHPPPRFRPSCPHANLRVQCWISSAYLRSPFSSPRRHRLTKTTPQAATALVSVHTSACGAAICAASCAALPSRWLPGRPRALGRHEPCTDDRPQGGEQESWWDAGSGERRGVQQHCARRLGLLPPLCRPLASPSRRASLSHNHTNPVCRPRPHPSRPGELRRTSGGVCCC